MQPPLAQRPSTRPLLANAPVADERAQATGQPAGGVESASEGIEPASPQPTRLELGGAEAGRSDPSCLGVGMVKAAARRVIAIDGPAASGKSSVARALARRLGYTFLDTGAMYRAVTLACLERGLDPLDAAACEEVAANLSLTFDAEGHVLIDGASREADIRGEAVTREVSHVSAHPGVRRALVEQQRRVAASEAVRGIVAEGRDMTSVVFPKTPYKFFLSASSAERARRRATQEGVPAEVERIEREIERRDSLDSQRADSPLRIAEGARRIDTDPLGVEQVVQAMLLHIAAIDAGAEPGA